MALVTVQVTSLEENEIPNSVQDAERNRRRRMQRRQSFVMVKGAALLLQDDGETEEKTEPSPTSGPSEQQLHLQAMLQLLREEDILKLAVRLEPIRLCLTRYLLVVSSMEGSNEEEIILLGVDFPHDGSTNCTIGTVLPVWSNTQVFLDGDGGFSVTSGMEVRAFKPISVQTMWSLLQMLHKACEGATSSSQYSGLAYYQDHRESPQACIHAWLTTSDIISTQRDPVVPEREETERIIRKKLRDILRESDLESITSKQVRSTLEQHTHCELQDYTEFIDNEMIMILAQMDRPSEIFPYLYLGSEWNASNLEELQKNKVSHILNVTREIDNFFPAIFTYLNIRVPDEESTNLLQHWKETHRFICSARRQGTRVLVHCKMGVSRSASTVIAYAMKEYEWTLEETLKYVKERRAIVQPNPGFMRQLNIYQGILGASKQRHSYLWDPSSTPPAPKILSPLETFHKPIVSTFTKNKNKMNLRTLMRSISVMETTEYLKEQEESSSDNENIESISESMESFSESISESMESISESMDSLPEIVGNVSESILENTESITDRHVDMEGQSNEKSEEGKNESISEDSRISSTAIKEAMQTEESVEADTKSIMEDTKECADVQKSSSVDEVFGSCPNSPQSYSPSSSSHLGLQCRLKHLFPHSAETNQGKCATKSQSVSDLEGAAIVSRILHGDEMGGRKGRITRQSNVAETTEEL
ncbi:protein phosphatase Slingshot homolog 3 [Bombina bombina]|uniref:protein phosphatase Slingshot homolog 3 n=1 Tax=Bombina bombina TaxID=8345 RepID=UPI00235ACFEE|nr:protein phosphatase Slingshot homolog 3 [Bombina bombina]